MTPPTELDSNGPALLRLLQEIENNLVRLVADVEAQRRELLRLSASLETQQQALSRLEHQLQGAAPSDWSRDGQAWIPKIQHLFGELLTPTQQVVCAHLILDACSARVAKRLGMAPSTVGGHARKIVAIFGLNSVEELPFYVCSHARGAESDAIQGAIVDPAPRRAIPVERTATYCFGSVSR